MFMFGEPMLTEYKNDKAALLSALELVDANLHANTASYAVVETEDPERPFELRWIHDAGRESAPAKLMNERLFDRGFLDFGYKEIRNEDNIEGISYEPIEELLVNDACIGVAPLSFFDEDASRVRMARGAEEDDAPEDNPSGMRFTRFLEIVRGTCIEGAPQKALSQDEVGQVCGLIFKYQSPSSGDCIVAFQRTQRMWIQQKSSFLFFNEDGAPEAFAGRSIKLGNGFDFIWHGDNLFFRNLRALEILFKYNRLSSQQAKDYADTLDPILADFEKLDERIDASRGVANKLLKMQKEGTPVAELSADELQFRANRIAYYSRKLKFNEDGKVMLTTNREVSDFLRLLNDTLLVSPLTSVEYEATSKKPLGSEE